MLWVLIFLLVFVCGNTFAAFNPVLLCDGGYPMAVATDDSFAMVTGMDDDYTISFK